MRGLCDPPPRARDLHVGNSAVSLLCAPPNVALRVCVSVVAAVAAAVAAGKKKELLLLLRYCRSSRLQPFAAVCSSACVRPFFFLGAEVSVVAAVAAAVTAAAVASAKREQPIAAALVCGRIFFFWC